MKDFFLDNNGFPLEVIKKGQYERVKLVQLLGEDSLPQGNRIYRFINKLLSPYPTKQPFRPEVLAKDILYGRKVWKCDVEQIPKGKNYNEKLRLADILVCTNIYNQSDRSNSYHYSAGLYLSDFLEIIPSNTAARIIYAASDIKIAEDLLEGKGMLNNIDTDSRKLAVESISLLPGEKRKEIFENMVAIEPPKFNHTEQFLNLIGSSWNYPGTGLSVPALIKTDLNAWYWESKIAEVSNDLSLLREIVESAK